MHKKQLIKIVFKAFVFFLLIGGSLNFALADETITSTNSTTGIRGLGANFEEAVKFTPSISGDISSLEACFGDAGNTSTSVSVRVSVYNDSGSGSPGVSELGGVTDVAVFNGYSRRSVGFSSPVSVVSGTSYWVVIRSASPADVVDTCGDGGGFYSPWATIITNNGASSWFNESGIWNVNFDIVDSGGGGGGGGGTATTSEQATSTVEQVQTNLFHGFIIFFISMIFPIWFFKRQA